MPQADLQTILTRLDDRLLKTEGQIFALKSIIGSVLANDDLSSGVLRKHIEGINNVLSSEDAAALDAPTARFVSAARSVISELLSAEYDAAKPRFTIIDGGKQED